MLKENNNPSFWPYEEDVVTTHKKEIRRKVVERINSDWYKQYIIQRNNLERTPVGLIHLHWYIKEGKLGKLDIEFFRSIKGRGIVWKQQKSY